ncbi:MAG: minor capsid protein [Ignavibacteria bacterium]|nr:minor capsid protein [Ignavibacteria bacterium]
MNLAGYATMAFNLKPKDAIEFLRRRELLPTWDSSSFTRMDAEHAFTSAKVMKVAILRDLRDALVRAEEKGETFQDFKKNVRERLEPKGWWRSKTVTDPVTGAKAKVDLSSDSRLNTIFRMNMQTALGRGRAIGMLQNSDTRPYWRYVSVLDNRTTPLCNHLNGMVVRFDDPFWGTHYPPNHFKCRGLVYSLSQKDVERRGYKIVSGKDVGISVRARQSAVVSGKDLSNALHDILGCAPSYDPSRTMADIVSYAQALQKATKLGRDEEELPDGLPDGVFGETEFDEKALIERKVKAWTEAMMSVSYATAGQKDCISPKFQSNPFDVAKDMMKAGSDAHLYTLAWAEKHKLEDKDDDHPKPSSWQSYQTLVEKVSGAKFTKEERKKSEAFCKMLDASGLDVRDLVKGLMMGGSFPQLGSRFLLDEFEVNANPSVSRVWSLSLRFTDKNNPKAKSAFVLAASFKTSAKGGTLDFEFADILYQMPPDKLGQPFTQKMIDQFDEAVKKAATHPSKVKAVPKPTSEMAKHLDVVAKYLGVEYEGLMLHINTHMEDVADSATANEYKPWRKVPSKRSA